MFTMRLFTCNQDLHGYVKMENGRTSVEGSMRIPLHSTMHAVTSLVFSPVKENGLRLKGKVHASLDSAQQLLAVSQRRLGTVFGQLHRNTSPSERSASEDTEQETVNLAEMDSMLTKVCTTLVYGRTP